MNKTMKDFAETDYKLILAIKDLAGMEDPTLVNCQQCTEKYLKYILRETSGEVNRTHNLVLLIAKLTEFDPGLRNYRNIARMLTDSYFDRRYESEDYIVLSPEDYQEYLEESMTFIHYLQQLCEKISK